MNTAKSKQQYAQKRFESALDQSITAALALKISETDIVNLLLDRLHSQTCDHPQRKMFNPDAGP